MRAYLQFLLFLALCLLLGGLLTYPAWRLLGEPFGLAPDELPTHLGKLLALIAFWPFLRLLRLDDRASLGFGTGGGVLARDLVRGWLWGVAILLVVALLLVAAEVRLPRAAEALWPRVRDAAGGALAAGLLVALIEETFFRGALHSALRRSLGIGATLLLSSLLYAALHFVRTPDWPAQTPFGWGDGLVLLAGSFHRFTDPASYSSFATLVLVGVLLGWTRERLGHIGLALGLHAGFVFTIALARKATTLDRDAPLGFLVGGYDGITGHAASLWLLLVLGLYWLSQQRHDD